MYRHHSLALSVLLTLLTMPQVGGSELVDSYMGDFGPLPALPEPQRSAIPTIWTAKAVGWQGDAKPQAIPGLTVTAFATDLDHPRWLYVLPNGDVLVAEANAPTRPDDGKGLKGWFMRTVMKKVGATVPSANRITLLRDRDGDGRAELKSIFLQSLNSPFGMALIDNSLYVANTDAVMRFPYTPDATHIESDGEKFVELPGGALNHHWTKNLIASPDGKYLYATVGSNSNVGENGMDNEHHRAAILQIEVATRAVQLFASGLRNPNGMAWNPQSGALWTVVNERDELGDHLVPDYLTSVKQGGFYGWPYSYFGQHVDDRVKPARPDLVASAIAPDYAVGSHTASLGLAFYEATLLPQQFRGGAFIGQHGSWNRKPPSGYKLIFIPFVKGQPSGLPQDILTGFLTDKGEAQGRPVGVAVDQRGAVLLADDTGNRIWRVTPDAAHLTAIH